MSQVLSGNEAIARAAWEAGATVATAYPGTPSTEIIQAAVAYPGLHAEWCPNEKVALEVALGAALGGARTLCAMKHVGLNVAADPLFGSSYTGIRAGLVIVTADDPGMFSSQNEQDNRHYAIAAKIPMLLPSDSQEAYEFTQAAFELSERLDSPVLIRTTTRISHSSGVVRTGERKDNPMTPGFVRDRAKNVLIPSNARRRHPVIEERLSALAHQAERSDLNRVEWGSRSLGVITGGVAYHYVKEVLPDVSILKLGLSHPLPTQLITDFCSSVDVVLVVEELDPVWETQIRAQGITVHGKDVLPITGELSPDTVLQAIAEITGQTIATPDISAIDGLPVRPPVMCPGCPHRGVFFVLRKLKLVVTGDIGCYSLGVQPPLEAMDTCVCMGASIGQAMGIELAAGRDASRNTVAVLGDSTFIHSGITGLIEVVYNRGHATVLILDNSTTAMTGHQPHPGTGRTISGEPTYSIDLEALCRTVGVDDVTVVDPFDLEAMESAVRHALAFDGPSVVITNRPCVLLDKKLRRPALTVSGECNGCGLCLRVGCPALEQFGAALDGGKRAMMINPTLCVGCDVCRQVCPHGAIGEGGGV